MKIQKAREERLGGKQGTRNLFDCVGRASTLHGEFYLSRPNADEVSWNHLSAEEQTQSSKAIEKQWPGVLDFKAVTIRLHANGCDQRKTPGTGDLLSPCSALEGDRHQIQGQG